MNVNKTNTESNGDESKPFGYPLLADAELPKFRLYYIDFESKQVAFFNQIIEISSKRLNMANVSFQQNEIIGFVQYSGYLDMKGEEICQGDILEMWLSGDEDIDKELSFKNEVIFKDGAFGYNDTDGIFHAFATHNSISKPQIKDAIIIGNVFCGCR